MNKQPIFVEKTYDASPAEIWTALTDKNEMKSWYFDLAEFKAEPGFKFEFTGGPSPEKQYLHLCEIVEAIPEKKLSYTWRYDGYVGNSLVSFELFPKGNKTLLRLTHEGLYTFPADNKDFDRSNFDAGWNDIINTSLTQHLQKSNA